MAGYTFLHFLVAQSCPTLRFLCLSARILEWVAIPFSRESGLNPGLLHCRPILYSLGHWVRYPARPVSSMLHLPGFFSKYPQWLSLSFKYFWGKRKENHTVIKKLPCPGDRCLVKVMTSKKFCPPGYRGDNGSFHYCDECSNNRSPGFHHIHT